MLKNPASIVLASLPQTVKREMMVSLGVAALLDGRFEHPERLSHHKRAAKLQRRIMYQWSFPTAC